jgi:hypothetical protein
MKINTKRSIIKTAKELSYRICLLFFSNTQSNIGAANNETLIASVKSKNVELLSITKAFVYELVLYRQFLQTLVYHGQRVLIRIVLPRDIEGYANIHTSQIEVP